jgi:hypothetical protein
MESVSSVSQARTARGLHYAWYMANRYVLPRTDWKRPEGGPVSSQLWGYIECQRSLELENNARAITTFH